jgi:branched-chain amino acid transport system permease protein
VPAVPKWFGWALPVAVFGLLALYPMLDPTTFSISRLELLLFYGMAAISLNLVHGYGGVLMLGQPALMTAAGYTTGILSNEYEWNVWVTISLATLASVLLSLFMASPGLRVRGWYLAVLSFMAVALVPDVVDAFHETTGGSDGLPGIIPIQFGGETPERWVIFEIVLLFTVIFWIASRNLVKSGWGDSLLALRDHPHMATASGVSSLRVHAALFALTGIPCGVAGALYAHSQQFFSASNFGPTLVLLLIGGVLLGGRGTLWGPLVGVAIFGGISFWLGPFSLWNPFILGVGVLVAALMFRLGIVGTLQQFWAIHGPERKTSRLLTEDELPPTSIAPLESPPRLEVGGISKHFGGTYALRDVGLAVNGGSILTVVGANGSGKTTLLNCVSGFVTPDEGEIVLNGENIVGVPAHRRAHLGIARTFQVPRLVEELTVLQNVEVGVFGLDPQSATASLFRTPGYRRRRREARERAMTACRAIGLSDRAINGPAGDLTLATRRMVEIARALAADASIICLDEPVAGLNHVAQDRVASVLRDLAASGRAVLLIEHNLPFVLSVSDSLVLLKDGELVDQGVPGDVGDVERPLGSYFQTFVATADRIKVQAAVAAARGAST